MTKQYVTQRDRFQRRSLAEAVELAERLGLSLKDIDIVHFEEHDWGHSETVSGLEYKRLETDAEYEKRLKYEDEQNRKREEREIAEFQRLSEKFNK